MNQIRKRLGASQPIRSAHETERQDLSQAHLETLVNPLRRLVNREDQDGDQEQAQQQGVEILP